MSYYPGPGGSSMPMPDTGASYNSPYPPPVPQGYNNGAGGYGGSSMPDYSAPPPQHSPYGDQQPQQYDEHGNPLPPGERGIGTMAMGGLAGFAGNKMMGNHGGGMKAAFGGAALAQGGKMLMDHLNKNKKPSGGHGGGYNPYGAQGGSSGGGLGSFFGGGKREI
ncbi:hypothetical protein FA09DRAFT_71535 [Tilletiopsis washingtonensis]|uniref:Uncharacterized protein n=1 Tax=Tilletiopsis washingtonensis TaxID=58919 RepID=A0A316Z7E9_9BASI|nr:hypothetical protein FA09DRAFT_71535 [Tilletiopsis washingtonensis]PWN96898.1 hypothetical protein FA09DRAFT_71535 [Tilletiopsis washingtonensis]